MKEPGNVPLSRREFYLIKNKMREALLLKPPHLPSSPLVVSDPASNQPTSTHIPSVFYPPPPCTDGINHNPPGVSGPFPPDCIGHPEFQTFPSSHLGQGVVYPHQITFQPQIHAPSHGISYNPSLGVHFPPPGIQFAPPTVGGIQMFSSLSSGFSRHAPVLAAQYQPSQSNWVPNLNRSDQLWNLHNQSGNLHSMPNMNATLRFNSTVATPTSIPTSIATFPGAIIPAPTFPAVSVQGEVYCFSIDHPSKGSLAEAVDNLESFKMPVDKSVQSLQPPPKMIGSSDLIDVSVQENKAQASTNLIQINLSNRTNTNILPAESKIAPQKTGEKVTRLHFIGGKAFLGDAMQKVNDRKKAQFTKESATGAARPNVGEQSRITLILESSQTAKTPRTSAQNIISTGSISTKSIATEGVSPGGGSNAVSSHTDMTPVEISDDEEKKSQPVPTCSGQIELKVRQKILIIGHTFVRQLYDSQRNFSMDADVVIDGLCGASVGQLNNRIRSLPKTHFDIVFIDVGSFDFLNPKFMPGDVARRIVNIGIYLTTEFGVKQVVISEIIPLRKVDFPSYYDVNINLANIALKNLTIFKEKFRFWTHAKPAFNMDVCFVPTGRQLSERGIGEFFHSVKNALLLTLSSVTKDIKDSKIVKLSKRARRGKQLIY